MPCCGTEWELSQEEVDKGTFFCDECKTPFNTIQESVNPRIRKQSIPDPSPSPAKNLAHSTRSKMPGWAYVLFGILGCLIFLIVIGSFSQSNDAQSADIAQAHQKQVYREAISRVMQQMNATCDQYKNSPEEICSAWSSIDTSQCPPDFRQAYVELIDSFDELQTYTKNNVPSGAVDEILTGVWNILIRGERDGGVQSPQRRSRTT